MSELRLLCLEEDDDCGVGGGGRRPRSFWNKAYRDDARVLRNLLDNEERYMARTWYFRAHQKDLRPYMRDVVARWMLEVCDEQEREEEVFPLSMNYFDRVLSSIEVKRDQLQLIGSTCLFIASKVREAFPISAVTIVHYTACSIELSDLLDWEMLILQILRWDTSSIIAHDFLHLLVSHLPLDESKQSLMLRHARTLVTMCIVDGSFNVHPPSVIASASLLSSASGLPGQNEGQTEELIRLLQELTSIESDCIRACCEHIEQKLSDQMIEANPEESQHHISSTDTVSHLKLTTSSVTAVTASTPTDVRDISLCQ